MNWYELQKQPPTLLSKFSMSFETSAQQMVKVAYTSKKHEMLIPKQNSDDGCVGHVALTESKNKVTLGVTFYTKIYSFPLFEETWLYDKSEIRRAMKSYNRVIHILEDAKADAEDDELPTPSLQGKLREELRYIDVERKKPLNNASLTTARSEPGESDWRNSLYGNRYPSPTINISNNGVIHINNDGR